MTALHDLALWTYTRPRPTQKTNRNNRNNRLRQVGDRFGVRVAFFMAECSERPNGGAARRRRERRMRSWFRLSSNPSTWPGQRCCTTRTTGCTPSTALHRARTQGESHEMKYRSGRLTLSRRSSSCTMRKTPCGGVRPYVQILDVLGGTVCGTTDKSWICSGSLCLEGFLSGQRSTASGARTWSHPGQQNVDPPVGGGGAEVFKVLVQDRIQQQRMWSISLTFQLAIEVFKYSRRPEFPQLPHRVDCTTTQMKEFKVFFVSHFSPKEKGAEVTRQSSARVHRHSSSSELSARQMALAGESDELWEDEAGDDQDAST